jgi:hypothetical protein
MSSVVASRFCGGFTPEGTFLLFGRRTPFSHAPGRNFGLSIPSDERVPETTQGIKEVFP